MPDLTRARIQKAIEEGRVKVNGLARKAAYKLRGGEKVEVDIPEEIPVPLRPDRIPLEIIYADSHIIVLDKPSGLVVHPGAGNPAGTLVNGLIDRFPEISGIGPPDRPGIVHRLDKETSGVMVVARSWRAYDSLKSQFKARMVRKVYLGLVWGRVSASEGRFRWPIGRHVKEGMRISIRSRNPKEAETRYTVLLELKRTTYLELRPVTGRTHQIRVHMAAAGHPIVGDRLYGRSRASRSYPRLFLHAHRLSFLHPESGERVEYVSPLPGELAAVLAAEQAASL